MFRSLITIISEFYLYLTKVIFMLKHSVKLHRYRNYVIILDYWGELVVDGWIILGWICSRWDVGIWTGLGWPRIETGGGRL
jgi:hypothetical protein